MSVSVLFIPDVGYRIGVDGKTVIVRSASHGRVPLTTKDEFIMAALNEGYMAAIEGRPALKAKRTAPLKVLDLPLVSDDYAYKFTDDKGLDYLRNGSFKVATPARYRHEENPGARDQHEGASSFTLHDAQQSWISMSLIAGLDTLLFCTTARIPRSQRAHMASKFGKRLVKIHGLRDFSKKLAKTLVTDESAIHDVSYTDYKHYSGASEVTVAIRETLGKGDLSDEKMHMLAERHSVFLNNLAHVPSVFFKPRRHALEQERRLSFRMPVDCHNDVQIFTCPDAVSHIEVII